jgi:hypothetical protein
MLAVAIRRDGEFSSFGLRFGGREVGEVGLVEGCRQMVVLCHRAHVADDPDFLPFRAVDSETDALPLGAVRARWSEAALRAADLELGAAEQLHRAFVEAACLKLLQGNVAIVELDVRIAGAPRGLRSAPRGDRGAPRGDRDD